MATQLGSRLVYQNAKQLITRAGLSTGSAVLSQSYIRSELAMSTTKTLYQFPILVNDGSAGTPPSTANLLNLQDAFVVSQIGFFVAKPSSSTDTTFQLCTYPNSVIFSTSGTAAALYSLYNGKASLIVNNRQIVPSWPMYKHYSVPQTQDGSSAAVIDEQDGNESAFSTVEPNIVLVGSKNNILQVELPAALAAVETSSRIVMICYGILCQNVTPVR